MFRISIKVLGVAALCAGMSFAGTIIGNADTGNCYPFACNDSGTSTGISIEYQQVYSASSFSGPTAFTALTFFGAFMQSQGFGFGPVLNGNYDITFWTTSAPVNGLSTNLNSNLGTSLGTFFNGGLGGTISGSTYTINGSNINYDPSMGNLLMQVIVMNQDNVPNGSGNGYFDADATGASTSRAYNIPNIGVAAADSVGLVTEFSGGQGTPEPGSIFLMISGGLGLLAIRRKLGVSRS